MVLITTFQDLYEASCKVSTLSLPGMKENQLHIEYLQTAENLNLVTVYNGQKPILPFARSDLFEAVIKEGRCLTADSPDCKAVYEVTFNIEGSNFTFNPGDTIGIVPQNDIADVEAIIEHLGLTQEADKQYNLSVPSNQKSCKIPPHIPIKSTIRHVLKYCCDIRSVLKKLFILALSRHTKDEDERKTLEYLCSKEGAVAYSTYILNRQLCLMDLLSIFKSCKPPIQVLFANLPRLLPRPYSIVNSSMKSSNIIKICFSVMDLWNNTSRKGLVTGWLESLIKCKNTSIEDKLELLSLNADSILKVPIYLRENVSGFAPPKDLDTPLILIGPGTGVAPFIGFLEQRHYLKEKSPDVELGSTWLFFGCRNPKLDFIYEKEMNDFLQNKIITRLHTSFSRIENSETKYVQDALIQNSEEIIKLIDRGAVIYVCGDLKNIEAEIKTAFLKCFVKSKPEDRAEIIFANLQADKRYLIDFWS